jgi:hypothetical protein
MGIRDIPLRVTADISGISVAAMLQRRCLYGADAFGERVGNSIYHCRTETLSTALAEALAAAGMGLRAAYAMVIDPKPQIVAALAGQGEPLTFWPRRDNPDEDTGGLSSAVKIVIDAAAIVRAAAVRLDAALEAERSRHPRRRVAFEPSALAGHRS